jgi:hypothetical protein
MAFAKKRHKAEGAGTWQPEDGDIVLFGVDSGSKASRLISRLTGDHLTHATTICLGDALVPEPRGEGGIMWRTASGERVYLFEAVSSYDIPRWDFLVGQPRCGIRLVDACQRLREVCVDRNRLALIRRVVPRPPELSAAIRRAQRLYAGCNYERAPSRLLAPIMGPPDAPPPFGGAFGGVEIKQYASGDGAFCSELLARVLFDAGALPTDRDPTTYSPGDFGPGGSAEAALAKMGYRLTTPLELHF